MPEIAFGIDYGTSNSAVAVAFPDHVAVVPPDAEAAPTLPSVAYLHRDGRQAAGEEAVREYYTHGHLRTLCRFCSLVRYGAETDCRQARRGGGCQDTRLVTGVKRDLARLDFTATHSWARDFELPELVAIVLARLKRAGDAAAGTNVRRAVLGHPVHFVGVGEEGKSQERALERLLEGARLAGFEEIELFPEPAAAVIGENLPDGLYLSADFGGGTFDAAVIEAQAGSALVRSLTGAGIGGERFDAALFETAVGPRLGLTVFPNWVFNEMSSLSGVRHLLSDPGLPKIIDTIGGAPGRALRAILFEGNAYGFYRAVEEAKIRLSTEAETRLEFRRPGLDLDIALRRSEFEAVIKEDLDQVEAALLDAVSQAGLGVGEIDTVLRTGGSSRLPAFIARLDRIFGPEKVRERDAFSAVAQGLAVRAREVWS